MTLGTILFKKNHSFSKNFFVKYSTSILIAILAFNFLSRSYNLHLPNTFYFDEVYHGITAQLIAENDPRAFEWWHPEIRAGVYIDWLHPPLAKYAQALGIKAFGVNGFGWRVSSAVFGTGVVWLTYLLAKEAFTVPVALLSAFLVSLDGLIFVQSRIAMNDIHVTFFILATTLAYFHYLQKKTWLRFAITWILAGLAFASKWSGLFIIASINILEFLRISRNWSRLASPQKSVLTLVKKLSIFIVASLLIPFTIYFLSYFLMFLQGKNLDHFTQLHQQIWSYQVNLTATHAYQSRPWQWFLNLRPVWYQVVYQDHKIGNIYAFGNPALHLVGVITVILIVLQFFYQFISKNWAFFKKNTNLIIILLLYFMVWLPWQLSPRIMFYYHYTTAIPFLCILISYWLVKKGNRKIIIIITTVIFLTFLIWYPRWSGVAVPNNINQVYSIINSWK
jgi:dolichyl-phosphate-mannose-protein mannosyltransferase